MDTQEDPTFVAAFARQRQLLAQRAEAALRAERDAERDREAPSLPALLVTALEVLKVAEDELLDQRAADAQRAEELARERHHYQALFELAPVAMLRTDLAGTIQECNHAALSLLGRRAYLLDRKPLSEMVARARRSEFRAALARLRDAGGVTDWRITLERATDRPVEVSVAVQPVPTGAHGGSLLWTLRPLEPRGD